MAKQSDGGVDKKAAEFEAWADGLGPDDFERTDDLSTVADAADAVAEAQTRLTTAVATARAQGRSWTQIGVALGVSRQAARQRFGQLLAK